jgi:hypothetical protein
MGARNDKRVHLVDKGKKGKRLKGIVSRDGVSTEATDV